MQRLGIHFLCIAVVLFLLAGAGPHPSQAATVFEVEGVWADTLLENTTSVEAGRFLGPVDSASADLWYDRVTYDFSNTPMTDQPGAEFYVYEYAGGNAEFMDMEVLVSRDGVSFVSIKSSEGAPVAYALPGGLVPRLAGDTVFSNAAYLTGAKVKGYDLGGLPAGYVARYIRVQGNITEPNSDGFDLDSVGLIHWGGVGGDVNGDGWVDVVDLLWLVDAFGSVTGDANYNAAADFNSDGSVDVVDLLILVENFGQ